MTSLSPVMASIGFRELLGVAHIFFNIGVFYLLFLGLIALHEAGHWTGARLCGFTIREFRLGPLRWLLKSGWEVQVRPSFIFTGLVRAHPKEFSRTLRRRYLTFILAGPIANILSGLCGLLLVNAQTIHSSVIGFLVYCSVGSILFGSINLIPVRGGALDSDGMQAFDVLFAKSSRKLKFVTLYLESKHELLESLRNRNFVRANELSEAILVFAKDIAPGNAMVKALHNILALSKQAASLEDPSPAIPIELPKLQ